MKKIIYTLLAILICGICNAQIPATEVEFNEYVYDFGQIKEVDGDVNHVFEFKNIGNNPFVITNISTSCGCTTSAYSREPIKIGQKSSIKIVFDPTNQVGKIEKRIVVSGNIEGGSIILTVKANGEPRPRTVEDDFPVVFSDGVRLADVVVNGYTTPNTKEATFTLDLINTATKAARISVVNDSLPKWLSVIVGNPILNGGMRTKILINVKPNSDLWGKKSVAIPIKVNDKIQFVNVIFNVTFVEDFSALSKSDLKNSPKIALSSSFYHFSTVNTGDKLEYKLKVKNNGINDLIIRYIDKLPNVKVQIKNSVVKQREETEVIITLDSSSPEAVAELIRFITNDPIKPVADFRIMANIK